MTVDDKITELVNAATITEARAAAIRRYLDRWPGARSLEYVSHGVVGGVYTLVMQTAPTVYTVELDASDETKQLNISVI